MKESRGQQIALQKSKSFYGIQQDNSLFAALRQMAPIQNSQQQSVEISFTKIIRDPLFYKPLRVGCILMMVQQFSGIRNDFRQSLFQKLLFGPFYFSKILKKS